MKIDRIEAINTFDFNFVQVHTVPKESDVLLHGDRPCPKYDALLDYYSNKSPEVRAIFSKYGYLFPYWSKMSGMNVTTIVDVGYLYKMLVTDKEQNRTYVILNSLS